MSLKQANVTNEKLIFQINEDLVKEKETVVQMEEILQQKQRKLEEQEAFEKDTLAKLHQTRKQLKVSKIFFVDLIQS